MSSGAPPVGGRSQPSSSGTFAALRVAPFRRLWLGGIVVFVAVTGQTVARGWLARELTGTNAGLGGVLLVFGLAMLLATPWGGVVADRVSKRLALVVSVALLTLSSAWVGLAITFDAIEYWVLVASTAIQAVAFALYAPARMAFTAELVGRDVLANAIVLGQMSMEGSRVAGPAAAGAVIASAAGGTGPVFLSAAGLCVLGAVTLLGLPAGRPSHHEVPRSPLLELAEGLKYVRARHALSLLVITSLGVTMVGFPYLAFLPTVADGIFDAGSGGYGLLSALGASGAVAAGLLTAGRRHRLNPWGLMVVAGLLLGGSLVVLAAAPSFLIAALILPLAGAGGLAYQSTNQSLLLTLSELEYHGRIQGLVMLGFSGFGLAALPLGLLADAIGLRATFALMGGGVLAIVVVFAGLSARHRRHPDVFDLG